MFNGKQINVKYVKISPTLNEKYIVFKEWKTLMY